MTLANSGCSLYAFVCLGRRLHEQSTKRVGQEIGDPSDPCVSAHVFMHHQPDRKDRQPQVADHGADRPAGDQDDQREPPAPEPADGAVAGADSLIGTDAADTFAWYTVKENDNLWKIAEKHLGNGARYKEIFDLNRDRVQPDGRSLVDADLIHPGWIFTMPTDASGPGSSSEPPARSAATIRGLPAGLYDLRVEHAYPGTGWETASVLQTRVTVR